METPGPEIPRQILGISAWMLELIMALAAVLRNYSDLTVVGALLVVNAVLGFVQEHRADGVVEALRRRLHECARTPRFKLASYSWPARPRRHRTPAIR
jgi:H+-transporting ATPase